MFFKLYTKSPKHSGFESPWCKRDLILTFNLDIKSQYLGVKFRKKFCEVHDTDSLV